MNEFLQAIGHLGATVANNLSTHLAAEGGVGVLLFGVFVHTMPPQLPSSLQEYWTWVRDALQTALPVRRP